ncbi:MAG: hypothetical protein JXP73_16360 [Deltaproteobacteria bacterium]|nr:hypothetical protein [Deltaproteobacteria bacterium]
MAGLFAAFALLGCGSGRKSGSGYASFRWNIYDIGTGEALSCAQIGANTVMVTLFDGAGAVVAQDSASCAGGEISTSEVPTGSYFVGFDLYGDPSVHGGVASLLDSFDLADEYNTRITLAIRPGPNDYRATTAEFLVRSFVVGWTFASGAPASVCAALGAAYVELDFSVVGASQPVTSRFYCTDGQGTSLPYPYPSDWTQTTTQWWLYLLDGAYNEIGRIEGGTVGLVRDNNINLGTHLFPY